MTGVQTILERAIDLIRNQRSICAGTGDRFGPVLTIGEVALVIKMSDNPNLACLPALEKKLSEVVHADGSGVVDGPNRTSEDCTLSLRGPCTDALMVSVNKTLDEFEIPAGSYIRLTKAGSKMIESIEIPRRLEKKKGLPPES